MRALVIDPTVRAAARQLLDHAAKHVYRLDLDTPPGDDPRFCIDIPQDYRAVFSYTSFQGKLFRHLSVSIPGTKYPSPDAMIGIAELFGFSGTENGYESILRADKLPASWVMGAVESEHCGVLIEEILEIPMVETNAKTEFENPPQIPKQILDELDRLRRFQETLAGADPRFQPIPRKGQPDPEK